MTLYIGSYTDAEHPNGINRIELDPATGALERREAYPVTNGLYFATDAARKILYTNEKDGLGSFAIEPDGRLVRRDFVSLGGKAVCHVAVLPGDEQVTWAAYSDGKAGILKVKDGRFGESKLFLHHGKGPNLPRQGGPHPHCAVPTPDGKHFAVCDLGLDAVMIYPKGDPCPLKPAGAGPRHIIYHPNGRLAFIVFELGDLVASYRCASDGRLLEMLDEKHTLQDVLGEPVDPAAVITTVGTAAAIRFSPDMKRVIVSNRFEHSLAVFDYDETTGKLAHRATTVLPGDWPRDFLFAGDTLALATMERSGDVLSLRYDPETGKFKVLATLSGFFRPVAVL